MTRKPPTRKKRKAPSKGKAQVKQSTTVRRGSSKGPVVHHEDKIEAVDVPVEPGPESVSVGYDIKYWASDVNHGMTMGTSAYVRLSCGETLKDLDRANEIAADLAYSYMEKNARAVQRDLDKFFDGD